MGEITDERRTVLLGSKLRELGAGASGDDGTLRAISRCFDCMGIAEDEIRAELDKWHTPSSKETRRRIWGTFKVCAPGTLLLLADDVYRHHVRELISRAISRKDPRLGTKAEILRAISAMTMHSRLDRTVEALALVIANEIFPGRGLAEDAKEAWPGEMEEKLQYFRTNLRQADRVFTPEEELRDPPVWAH
jgi:hypothetical protein